jgi:hypothetical protein
VRDDYSLVAHVIDLVVINQRPAPAPPMKHDPYTPSAEAGMTSRLREKPLPVLEFCFVNLSASNPSPENV